MTLHKSSSLIHLDLSEGMEKVLDEEIEQILMQRALAAVAGAQSKLTGVPPGNGSNRRS